MKKVFTFCCFLLLLAIAGIYAQAVDIDTGIRRSAEFFEQQLQRDISIAVLSVSSDSLTLSGYIIDELSAHFVNGRFFTVVDRRNLEILQHEINFHLSGEVSDETAQAIGQRVGAETVILGSIVPLGNVYRLDLRALSVATGVIQSVHRQDIEIDRRLAALIGGQRAPVSEPWHHNRFTLGLRAGGGYAPLILGALYTLTNFHAAASITGQITEWFGIQAELMWSYYMEGENNDWNENRFLIPLLARLTFTPGNFSYGFFGGLYLSFPGTKRYIRDNIRQEWIPRSGPAVGVMLGGNFGYRIGPGVLLFDLRGHLDVTRAEYDVRHFSNGHFLGTSTGEDGGWRGGFNFSIGYEIGLFGRR